MGTSVAGAGVRGSGSAGAVDVLVCGPIGSVIVDGVAMGLAARRGEPVGHAVRVLALSPDDDEDTLLDLLHGVRAVVHVARDPADDLRPPREREAQVLDTATRLFAAIARSGVGRLVLVTSAVLYGPSATNPLPLRESHALVEPPNAGLVSVLLAVEELARQLRGPRPDLRLTLIRPAALVAPGIDGDVTRHFAAPRLLGLRGHPMAWQFCHVHDLAGAIELALDGTLDPADPPHPGPGSDAVPLVAVGAVGWLTDDEVERVCGKRRIDLSEALVFGTAERLQRIGASVSGSLPALVYPWVVDPARLVAVGWQPRYDNEAALRALMVEARSVLQEVARRRGREAAGAAGATVAALGTALVVRRARRRRHQG